LELRDHVTSDPNFFQNLITGDESWMYGYDPETKVQNSQWKTLNSPRPKKARQSKASVKVMSIVFFDLEGIVRSEFVPSGTTVNSAHYKGVLECLRNDVRRKRPQKWANVFVLHHDSAPRHTSLLIHQFLSDKNNITVWTHPPCSTDLAPCDFWLFSKLKLTMKGKRFASIPEIEAATTTRLKGLKKMIFRTVSRSGRNVGTSVWQAKEDYFEGD
jgi:histone-lysine N-methyltransferase SETMAR